MKIDQQVGRLAADKKVAEREGTWRFTPYLSRQANLYGLRSIYQTNPKEGMR